MMYVRVCACVGQTLLSYARGFPRGPKTYRRRIMCMQSKSFLFLCVWGDEPEPTCTCEAHVKRVLSALKQLVFL